MEQKNTVVIWIDWYAYHHARLRALVEHPAMQGQVAGIELVGRTGVHKGLVFREQPAPDLPVRTLLPGSSWSRSTQIRLSFLLWRELSRLNPSNVLVPGYYTLPGLTSAIWGRLHGRRTILMTESTQYDHQRTSWKESAKSLLLRALFHSAVAGGRDHVRYLRALGFPTDRIGQCYDVVDNQFFAESARGLREAGQAPDPALRQPYFLYVGRFAAEKNLLTLIRAYEEYRRAGGSWPLVLVGAGPEEQNLRKAAEQSGFRSDVHFPGLKSTQQLPAWYASAGCFVLPSSLEPWGLVTNEAMASGLPVIVSDRCGCAADLVRDGENGFTFDPNRITDLADRLTEISRMPEADRARMAKASETIISQYSPERWASEVARLQNVGTPAGMRLAPQAVEE